ncbi:hypothetical protein [Planktothrix sp. PCC 11201]|nr:hypothetical protein [Planktothrix sp. PCC 11201]
MKKYTFGCCDAGKSADSYSGKSSDVLSIIKQASGATQEESKMINSIG